jgi:hypothetical protein
LWKGNLCVTKEGDAMVLAPRAGEGVRRAEAERLS